MQLATNEFTIKSFIKHLNTTYKKKKSGKVFNSNDVAQYLIRGYLPYQYGGYHLSSTHIAGIRIITVHTHNVKIKKDEIE